MSKRGFARFWFTMRFGQISHICTRPLDTAGAETEMFPVKFVQYRRGSWYTSSAAMVYDKCVPVFNEERFQL